MRTRYVRTEAGRHENMTAGAVALALGAGVAAVAFYLARTLLARERITTGAVRERITTGADVVAVERSDADSD